MARGLLPRRPSQGEGVRLRHPRAHRHRGQRHLLQAPEPRHLRQVARRRARRLRLRAQGLALLHQSSRPGRSRRRRRQLPRPGPDRAGRQARPDQLAARRNQAVRRRRDCPLPRPAPARASGRAAPPCDRGTARQLRRSPLLRAGADSRRRDRLCPCRQIPDLRRADRSLHLCPPPVLPGGDREWLRRGGPRPLGRASARLGGGRPRRLRLLHRRRQGQSPRRRHGADRAGGTPSSSPARGGGPCAAWWRGPERSGGLRVLATLRPLHHAAGAARSPSPCRGGLKGSAPLP